jgi:hypothetical protein
MEKNNELHDLKKLLDFEIKQTKKMVERSKKENNFKDCLEYQANLDVYVFVLDTVNNLIKGKGIGD